MTSDEIDLIEEIEEEAYVEYDIATYPSDYTLESLQQMMERNDIVIPRYQRNYVWNIRQASLLVESFLLGLPVPPLFLYVRDDNKSEVIDGQQRLLSMMYFLEGYFGTPNAKGMRQTFALTGLSEKSPFKRKTFAALDEKFQRKLRGSVLRAINVRQLSPNSESTSVFHIFERLNTGGTSLKPQEIRNAVFLGPIVEKIRDLNCNSVWKGILGIKVDDKYQRDVELILRLFSLFQAADQYEKPMKEYLNKSMKANARFDTPRALEFERRFGDAVTKVTAALGPKPFRPKRVINAAVLEAVMVSVLENPEITVPQLKRNYTRLLANDEFEKVIRGATTDTKIVKDRLKLAREILDDEVPE